jgi:hypothetical protein
VALVDAGVHEQDDDRADDAGRLEEVVWGVLMEDQVAQDPPDERADDADDRGQDADVLSTGDQQPCDCAGDQSDDSRPSCFARW